MTALNPLTFLLTWSGRQLETYTQGNKTIEFEYDENGLRHRKTVKENGIIIERYDYVWSEGTLISQTYSTYSNGVLDSTNSAKFIYDAWGTLQGFVLNDTSTYLYTKNLQGDILSIVNESGQTIVTYEYDSWGAVSFSATSMQNLMLAYTLSFVSPFAYRSYCYDYDIELYYLQSRYYSAEIGRFINTDDTQIAIATMGTVLGANLFAYCNNNPVMNVDYNGFEALTFVAASAAILLVGLFCMISYYVLCDFLLHTAPKINAQQMISTIGSLWKARIDKIKQKLLLVAGICRLLVNYLSLAKSVAIADAKIKAKVKKNSRIRYWEAFEGPNGTVVIGKGLSFTEAVNRVKSKKSVFAVSKYEARVLANRVGNAMHHNKHGSGIGFYNHYQIGHVHIWYLF